MTYKLKSKADIEKISFQDKDGDFWISKKEMKKWDDSQTHPSYYKVIENDQDILGAVISNDKASKYVTEAFGELNDTNFRTVFEWCSDFEITEETHPEYFI